jgi:BMFP domain-containing protein YqiC|tara:strand:- start:8682 stop:9086 length:405 start_codon:yes stop_codon:yes gene_type:complete
VATLAFDSLRYARRLREAGVPEPQADAQAELMAEAFGFYADNIVTRDYLDAVLRAGFGEQAQRFERIETRLNTLEARLDALDARLDKLDARLNKFVTRLEKLEPLRIQATLHSFMLGLIVVVQVVPQLQAWLVH